MSDSSKALVQALSTLDQSANVNIGKLLALARELDAFETSIDPTPTFGTVEADTITEYTAGSGTTFSTKAIFSVPSIQSTTTGIIAAGTNQATATALTTYYNNVTTCSVSTKGVVVYGAVAGKPILIRNSSANAFNVYPGSGDGFDAVAVDSPIVLAVGSWFIAWPIDATTWYTNKVLVDSATGTFTTVNGTTGTITTLGSTTATLTRMIGGAGTVSSPGVVVGANDNGFYEVSSSQLGVSIGNALVGGFNTTGAFTDIISEQTTGAGVTADSVLLKDAAVTTGTPGTTAAAALKVGSVTDIAGANAASLAALGLTKQVNISVGGVEFWVPASASVFA